MRPSDSSPSIPPDALVEHSAFVRRIAWEILRDDADADDAAQETLVRGLISGPAEPRARVSWLATVARNAARALRRGRTRADGRERRTAGPDGTTSAADAAVRAETIRAVAEAVASLDEPMRTAVILRHYDGLPPRVIAARLDESVDAVKKRLQRAHELLRARLEQQRPGGGTRWRAVLAGFAGVPFHRGGGASASSTSAAGSIAEGAGGVAMANATKIGIGAVAAALLGIGSWMALGHIGDERSARDPSPPSVAEGTAGPVPATPALATARAALQRPASSPSSLPQDPMAAREAPPVAATAPARPQPLDHGVTEISGVVTGAGGSVSGAVVRLRRGSWGDRKLSSKPPPDPEATIPVAADGMFRRSGLAAGEWYAELAAPGLVPRFVSFTVGDAGPGMTVPLGDGTVEGRFYDRDGRPIADAVVQASPRGGQLGDLHCFAETRTIADGSFRVDGLTAGSWWLVGYEGEDRRAVEGFHQGPVFVEVGKATTQDLGVPHAAPRWTGVVRTRAGKPVRGPGELRLSPQGGGWMCSTRIDVEGRFSQRFPAGVYGVAVVYIGGGGTQNPMDVGEMAITLDVERDVVLPGSRLTGTVLLATTGAPQGVRLSLISEANGTTRRNFEASDDGTFVVDGLPAGRYRIEATSFVFLDARGDFVVVQVTDEPAETILDLVARAPR